MWNPFKSPRVPKSLQGTEVYEHILGRRFDPGAMAEAFEPLLGNPVYLFRGSGRLAGSLSKFQPPQVWFNPVTGVQGLGGVQAGQYVGQPLLDPSQLSTEGGG
jgi:hypothetical protein